MSATTAGREIEGTGELLAELLAEGTTRAQELHAAIADRSFGATGAAGRPAKAVHNQVAALSYGAVRAIGGGLLKSAAFVLQPVEDRNPRPISRSPRARAAIGAVNGIIGDDLAERGNGLAVGLAVRRHGEDVPLTRAGLAAAFPHATPTIAVLVHGLCETDESWRPEAGRTRSLGGRLAHDLNITPVHLRYNTGLPIAENGAELDRLLDGLLASWPVPPEGLVLIGHSMGGLVLRAAAHLGMERRARWTRFVRDTVALGTPHLGAPLEQGVALLGVALDRLPEARPLIGFLDRRSAGIKDLRHGAIIAADREILDARKPWRHRRTESPLLPDARHHALVATLTEDHRHPVGRFLGDLLVRHGSGTGEMGAEIPFEPDRIAHLGGLTHFDLLHHPRVIEQVARWLAASAA